MKAVVLVKHVPDTIEPRLRAGRPDLQGVPRILNPFDLHAVEEAVRIGERPGPGIETFAVTAGRPEAEAALREALAMGIGGALCVDAPELDSPDAGVVFAAVTLAAAVGRLGDVGLVLCGQKSLDQQTGMLPAAVAEALGYAFIPDVGHLELGPRTVRATRLLPDGRATVECDLPAVVAVLKPINEPRIAPLRGMMKARRAQIAHVGLTELDLPSLPRRGTLLGFGVPPARPQPVLLSGDVREQARRLVGELRKGGLV